jgi:arsenate reductase
VKFKVLFVCGTNGVHSPMAEALLNGLDSMHFEAISAGVDPGAIHPFTVEVMKEIGVDLGGKLPKAVQDLRDQDFDFVITLCDRARLKCPGFDGAELVHWQFEDPLAVSDQTQRIRMFQSLRDQIAQRIRLFALVQVRFAPVERRVHYDSGLQTDLVHL